MTTTTPVFPPPGEVYWPNPLVYREAQPGDRIDRPTGTTHAFLEPDLTGASTPQEVVERSLSKRMTTACGLTVAEMGEGMTTRSAHLHRPGLDGHILGGDVDCPDCVATRVGVS